MHLVQNLMRGVLCGQANSWSLEELHLDVTIAEESDQPSFDDCSFGVEGLKLTGAVCRYFHFLFLPWIKNL